jgi:hypothetical protein
MLAPCKHVKVGIKAIFKGLANKRRTMCEKRKEKKAKQKLGGRDHEQVSEWRVQNK